MRPLILKRFAIYIRSNIEINKRFMQINLIENMPKIYDSSNNTPFIISILAEYTKFTIPGDIVGTLNSLPGSDTHR